MTEQPRTREELYERIRRTSRAEFVLAEMIRLGFWPAAGQMPQDPADEIRRQGDLLRELRDLQQQQRQLKNEKALLKRFRAERLAESRRKREETKQRREAERQARAAAWREKQQQTIVYIGEGDNVSASLSTLTSELDQLQAHNLPVLDTPESLAALLNVSVSELRFLAYNRRVSTVSHYVQFRLPKKTGGTRLISAPLPRLKRVQYAILRRILAPVPLEPAAQGFRPEHSIVTNALPHVGADVVVNIDLKDFFPSITYQRVRALFNRLGYSRAIATLLALLCTEPETVVADLDGKRYFIAQGERYLPQGAPTSPAITNILCRQLDRNLTKLATQCGFRYSRYADDLTFSAQGEAAQNVNKMLWCARHLVKNENLTINEAKTRILRRGRQQEVTGLIVNEKLAVDRTTLRRFRATLFQVEKDGPVGKRWGQGKDVLQSLWGFANFVAMVDPAKGQPLKARVRTLMATYGGNSSASPSQDIPNPTPATVDSDTVPTVPSFNLPPTTPTEQPSKASTTTTPDTPTPDPLTTPPWWKMW
jgi:RNA-directed DNA polymerase